MGVLGEAAAERLGRPLKDAEVIEVYSCFPSAVRVQQRELGLPLDGTPTVTGGMAFAGGPFNNFVYQATAAVVGRVRAEPGSVGVVTTVCGLLTKPGLAAWSAEPDGRSPLLEDLAERAASATPTVPVLETHKGPATVASYTVTADNDGPCRVAVIAEVGLAEDRARCVAVAEDRALAATLADRERTEPFIGTTVAVDGIGFAALRAHRPLGNVDR